MKNSIEHILKEQKQQNKRKFIQTIINDYGLFKNKAKTYYKNEETQIKIYILSSETKYLISDNITEKSDYNYSENKICHEFFSLDDFIETIQKVYNRFMTDLYYSDTTSMLHKIEFKVVIRLIGVSNLKINEINEHYFPNECIYYAYCKKIKDSYLRVLYYNEGRMYQMEEFIRYCIAYEVNTKNLTTKMYVLRNIYFIKKILNLMDYKLNKYYLFEFIATCKPMDILSIVGNEEFVKLLIEKEIFIKK